MPLSAPDLLLNSFWLMAAATRAEKLLYASAFSPASGFVICRQDCPGLLIMIGKSCARVSLFSFDHCPLASFLWVLTARKRLLGSFNPHIDRLAYEIHRPFSRGNRARKPSSTASSHALLERSRMVWAAVTMVSSLISASGPVGDSDPLE